MSNPTVYTFRGDVTLAAGVSRCQIETLFKGVYGLCFFSEGKLLYEYSADNWSLPADDTDPADKLEELVSLGWNTSAWEEAWLAEPEVGAGWSGTTTYGTTKQKLRFPREVRWQAVRAARERRLSRAV